MLWIVLAAQLSLPTPDPRTLFSGEDMPAYVQIQGINRFISTRTTVKPDGTTQDCGFERGSGDRKLDALTCAIILRRATFQPATWVDGSPAYAVFRTPVSWTIGGPPSKKELRDAYSPDITITVSRLPEGAPDPTNVHLMIAVDESGRIVACDEAPKDTRDHSKTFPALAPLACQEMARQLKPRPAKDGSGNPVRSVQSATANVTTKP